MSKTERRTTDWADDDDDTPEVNILPTPSVTTNPDGTETHITYRLSENGKKIKTTRVIKKTSVTHRVNPRIAERRQWAKFGASAKDAAGPQSDTTSVGENIELNLKQGFKGQEKEDAMLGSAQAELEKKKAALQNTTVKCRICQGEHFTARCPFKGTMAPEGEPAAGDPVADPMAEGNGIGGLERGKTGKYVPPSQRLGAQGGGEKMGGKYERDDLATLRVTNVSEYAEEQDLRDMFDRWGRVTRVFLAKDRETGRAKGFAFISFADRDDAAKACERMDGYGYNNLILRVEFAKRAP